MLSGLLGSIAGKVAIGVSAVTVTTGGLAAAGALPDPVQSAVADAADKVGVSLPDPDKTDGEAGTVAGEGEGEGGELGQEGEGEETAANRGNCVSYATRLADSLQLSGAEKGRFVAAVARADGAATAPVAEGGTPDPPCAAAIDAAASTAAVPNATVPKGPGARPEGRGRPEGGPTGRPAAPGRPTSPAGQGGGPQGGRPATTPTSPPTTQPPTNTPPAGEGGAPGGREPAPAAPPRR